MAKPDVIERDAAALKTSKKPFAVRQPSASRARASSTKEHRPEDRTTRPLFTVGSLFRHTPHANASAARPRSPRQSRDGPLPLRARTVDTSKQRRPASSTSRSRPEGNRPTPLNLTLQDLDGHRPTLTVAVRPGLLTAKLAPTIRQYSRRPHCISDCDDILFYALSDKDGPRVLPPGERLGDGVCHGNTVFYRPVAPGSAKRWDDENAQLETAIDLIWTPEHARSHHNAQQDRGLSEAFVAGLVRDIADPGARLSVGDVRARVATALEIDDPNRIALVAGDGVLPDQLMAGSAWQLRRLLRSWLCRRLTVLVCPPRGYVVVRGGGGVVRDADGSPHGRRRVYVYPCDWDGRALPTVHRIQAWVRDEVWPAARQDVGAVVQLRAAAAAAATAGNPPTRQPFPRKRCRTQQIPLFDAAGKPLVDNLHPLPRGSSVEFRLPDDLVEASADAESWLLLPTETCIICCDAKPATQFPHRVAMGCCVRGDNHNNNTTAVPARSHTPNVCKDCLAEWIRSSLQDKAWDQLKCPECPAFLAHADVRLYAAPAEFARYEQLATRAAVVRDFPNFRWCLAPGCESGQIHEPPSSKRAALPSSSSPSSSSSAAATAASSIEESCPKFRCHACRAAYCINHNVPWHSGETCAQYDVRTKQRRREEQRKSDQWVQKHAKECPQCHKMVHKYEGCNHITCLCGHEWCYLCFAPFVTTMGILRCRHKAGCTERDLAEELDLLEHLGQPDRPFRAPPRLPVWVQMGGQRVLMPMPRPRGMPPGRLPIPGMPRRPPMPGGF
ncbi:ring finger protein [Niveomyces insectorum RCEF 264]|uniref:RBR-type E3 ubiquitin transferase n=1 Tax=Niveomyces insectorum RCEF 264 TaxID=1081102 RepID=A0A167XUT4_9HYPO|nr:ring finger protein [Niveomyces insectorum RCEF 264]